MFQLIAHSVATVLAGVVLASSSCVTVVNTPPTGGNDGGGGGGNGAATTITVRFINATTSAVDPQFFATSAALGDPEQVLFLPANQITTGIGFAGAGIVAALSSDEITINCDQAVTIGTRGGRFVNQDTGVQVGTGQQRVAAIHVPYECGDVITITFGIDGSTFTTGLSFE